MPQSNASNFKGAKFIMGLERHTYEYDVDPTSNTAPAAVIRFVGEGRRVLEIGCGPGSITKILAGKRSCAVTGIDVDEDSIKRVAPFCDAVFKIDLNDKSWPDQISCDGHFDVVVAADVLEHLYDPIYTLSKMTSFLSENGFIVISLPHVGHSAIIGCLLNGDFSYRDWGLLDKTHIRFFCLKNIENMFFKAKLKIVDFHYVVKAAEETEFAAEWSALTPQAQSVLRSSPHAEIYQVVVKAIPFERPGVGLSLSTTAFSTPSISRLQKLRGLLLTHVSPDVKRQLRRMAKALRN